MLVSMIGVAALMMGQYHRIYVLIEKHSVEFFQQK